jgi:hypothetical protein
MEILIGKRVSHNAYLIVNRQIIIYAIGRANPSASISNQIARVIVLDDRVFPYARFNFYRFSVADWSVKFCHDLSLHFEL